MARLTDRARNDLKCIERPQKRDQTKKHCLFMHMACKSEVDSQGVNT